MEKSCSKASAEPPPGISDSFAEGDERCKDKDRLTVMTSDPATSTVSAAAPPSLGAGAAASTVQGPPVSEQERTIDQETLTDHGGPPLSETSSDLSPPPNLPTPNLNTSSHSTTIQTNTFPIHPDHPQVVEEDAVEPPPTKRLKLSNSKSKPTQVQLNTHDDQDLEEFVLYLPPELPRVMVQSSIVLEKFVSGSLKLYLSLWRLSKCLKVVDLRFQLPYSAQLNERYITTLLKQLTFRGKEIKRLYLPCVTLHEFSQLEAVLRPLIKLHNTTIAELFLPLKCSLSDSDVDKANCKEFVNLITAIKLKKLWLVSSDTVVDTLQGALQISLVHEGLDTTVEVVSPDKVTGLSSYLSDLKSKSKTTSETTHENPMMLFNSLNMSTEIEEKSEKIGIDDQSQEDFDNGMEREEIYTTDLTYLDDSKPNCVGLYPSKIWNLANLHKRGTNGTGTTIAIIDSGINYMHATFKGRIIAVKNFVPSKSNDQDCAIDSFGHGTHCAGIAVGQSFTSYRSSKFIDIPSGVAPGARLIVCKVVDNITRQCRRSAFLNALKWLKLMHKSKSEQQIRPDVISISLGVSKLCMESAKEISELSSLGIIVVCAASNNGRLRLQPVTFPARLGHVLCIGAHNENGKPTSLSPVGREMDFLAPGQYVWGPGSGTKSPFAMDCGNGTSCAAPAVAGLVCLVLQAVAHIYESDRCKFCIGGRPLVDLVRSVWVMRELLKEMSSSPGHHSEEIGYGTLNPHRLLDRSPDELLRWSMMSSDPATSTASAENELSFGVNEAAPTIPVLLVAVQERMVQTSDQENLADCDTPFEAASPLLSAITEHGECCGCPTCLPSVFSYSEVSSDLVPPSNSSLACVETVSQHSPTDQTQPEPTNEVETDSCGPPPPKRPRLSKPTKVQLKTHDNKSLEKFVLYLPPKFPEVMDQVIEEFVCSSLRLYSSLWKLAKTLKVVDLRFQLPYSTHLNEKGIARLLLLLPFRGTTIEKFLLPCVKLHTGNQLEVVLKPLTRFNNKTNNNRIIQLFLPLECSLTEKDVDNLNCMQIIYMLSKIAPDKLCLVSRSADFNIMVVLKAKFEVELARIESSITIVVVFPAADELTGLSFLSSLKSQSKIPSETRPVNPTMLFKSLNMSTEVEERSEEIGIDEDGIEMESGEETFTTDLTYLESSKLSCTRLYPSKFWNLASLHDHGTNGTGVNIAIIDSGINYMHATFKGRIIAIKNFVPSEDSDQDCVIDTNGHGTYCAGIAIGQLFDSPQGQSSICIPSGVAPGAHLTVCKVADTTGKFHYNAFINALKWLKSEHISTSEQHIDVVSISLGISKYSKECSQAISELTSLGIIVVCAASNNGRLRLQPVTFPARLGHVLCIGAHDENGKPTSLSPVGREMDFLAPGQDVWGPGPGTKSPFAMDCGSGTSCAAPAVAGLVCLVLQTITRIYESDQDKFCIGKRPLKEVVRSVWVMRELLKEMSSSPGHHSEEIGYGTLNPHRLLDRSPDELLRVIREIVQVLD